MTRCWGCGSLRIIYDLVEIDGRLLCSDCRASRANKILRDREKEVTVEKKPIASVQVFEQEGDNYAIDGYVRFGGVKIEIDTDVNQVRDFFTKRRERKPLKGRP